MCIILTPELKTCSMENIFKLKNIITEITKELKKQDFLVYFRKMSILEIKDNIITFGVESGFMKNNLEAKFIPKILKAAQKEDSDIVDIKLQIDDNIDVPSNPQVIDCSKFYKEAIKPTKKTKKTKRFVWPNTTSRSVNERYTLDKFIVWPDSQLAHSACEAVTQNPWKSYNPLYIYGDVGLWKTHLLQATGNKILSRFKGKKVLYTTADKFITEYVAAVKKRSVERLREKYREIDVLIIDDVQFLSKKEQTQNELYNIFNLLYDSSKQIIISWDRAPKELTELEPRLRSRFEWGITVDIWRPDFETRLAIIQEKAREREFLIPQDVSEFIAANVTENVRELEWVLNQLIAEYELTGNTPILTRVAAKLKQLSYTSDLLGAPKNTINRIQIKSYEDIIDAVSNHFWIEKEGILWANRKKEFMIPRQVSMYLLKTKMNYTYQRIGNIFDGRNHAAVLYSCNKVWKMLQKDQKLLHEVNIIKDGIGL